MESWKISCKGDCKICQLDTYLHPTWCEMLKDEFDKKYFKDIKERLHASDVCYPPTHQIFRFSELCPLKDVKVVILGQDPYHGVNQAEGLSFSVPMGVKAPPSLKNIFNELKNDIDGFKIPNHGNLIQWAKQGVLLLNDTLTVAKNTPASHSKIGWKLFTQRILEIINNELSNVVFMLWGNHAKEKMRIIDKEKHLILTAAHPSPFSVKNFFGCKHFSKANEYLEKNGKESIDWCLD